MYLLTPAIMAMAVMEVVGIVSIVPFLSLVSDPDALHENRILRWLYETFAFTSVNEFLLFLGFLVLGVMVLSNAFSVFVTWALARFSWMRNHSLSKRLLRHYLHRPYVFFLNRNTAGLAKNILTEVQEVINGVLAPGMQMLARAAVAVLIIALLIAVDPVLALSVVVVLGGAYGAIYGVVRRRLRRLGDERVHAQRRRFQIAGEAFGGVKALKLSGREEAFIQEYAVQSRRYASHQATNNIIGQIPRYALETVAFGGILLIVLYLLNAGRTTSQILPLLGLYAFAGYRLLPSLQQIFLAITRIRFNAAALDELYRDLSDVSGAEDRPAQRDAVPLPFERALELRGVTFRYPGAEAPVFENLSLTIRPNTSVAFVGPTGSGKTTLIDLVLGLLRPQEGAVTVDGVAISGENLACWQKKLGYVPQHIYLSDTSVTRNIAFGVPEERIDPAAVRRAAKIARVHEFIMAALPRGYETAVGEQGVRLSGGQRQRLGIARALYHDPEILVLDEATSALDGVTEESVFEAIGEIAQTKTVLMIAHRLSTVRACDQIFLLDRGRLVDGGTYDELISRSAQFRAMAQVSA